MEFRKLTKLNLSNDYGNVSTNLRAVMVLNGKFRPHPPVISRVHLPRPSGPPIPPARLRRNQPHK